MSSALDRTEPRCRRCHDGPGRHLEVAGRQIALDRDILHVGRGLGADLRLDHVSVSRRHAVIVQRREEVRLLDDRSAGGTFVNGRRIFAATLSDGDEIEFGDIVLVYRERP
jgi:pSer/pThr/pTyr-binding forkhead associated (FHA) protein